MSTSRKIPQNLSITEKNIQSVLQKLDTLVQDIEQIKKSYSTDARNKFNVHIDELYSTLNGKSKSDNNANKSKSKKYHHGGFQDAPETISLNPNEINTIPIMMTSGMNADDPVVAATKGIDVTLSTPDSFTSGAYIDNNALPVEVSKIVLPQLGNTTSGGSGRKARKSTHKKK